MRATEKVRSPNEIRISDSPIASIDNVGEYANLWAEALSMKQAKKNSTDGIEELDSRAKSLCLQGQFGRAAKSCHLRDFRLKAELL